jgi:Na+-driven multidrug efflux pump
MSSTGSTYGDIHRYEPPRESTAAAIAIVLLTVVEIVFVGLFTYGLVDGWGYTGIGNMYLGTVLAIIFIDLAFILLLYRKEFLPDVMIVKKRRRKWEDLYIEEDQMHGVESFGGAWDSVKRAVYPYYKK